MTRYIITHGLPASGKSTWAKQEIERLQSQGITAIRVNRDNIRTKLFGYQYHSKSKYDPKDEDQVEAVEQELINSYLQRGHAVINDNTNLKLDRMGSHLKTAKKHGVEIEQQYFDVSPEECKRRNALRGEQGGRRVPDFVIDGMAKKTFTEDGRIKHIRLGEHVSYAFDPREKYLNQELVEQYNTEQQSTIEHTKGAAVLVDMDGTLADMRVLSDKYMSDSKNRDFHKFHSESQHAPAHQSVVNAVQEFHNQGIPVIITTARSSKYAPETIHWLKDNNIPASSLYMRKEGDYRKDYEVKKEMLEDIRSNGYDPYHALDDNPQAIQAWEENGLKVTTVPFHQANAVNDPTAYEPVDIATPFAPGTCMRCGSALKDKTKVIGDKCRRKM